MPPPRRPGPTPAGAHRTRADQQRQRRDTRSAKGFVKKFIGLLFEKRILQITHTGQACDVARLEWLCKCMDERNMPFVAIAAISVLDWAVRSPEYTGIYISSLSLWTERSSVACEVDRYLYYWSTCQCKSFWSKHTALNLRKFLESKPCDRVISFAADLQEALTEAKPRMTRFLGIVAGWPHMGAYTSLSLLRALGAVFNIKFRDVLESATNMSLHTSVLARVVPLREAQRCLQHKLPQRPDFGFLAWVFCEGTKILRHEAVLQPLEVYASDDAKLCEDLSSSRARALLSVLEELNKVEAPSDEVSLLHELAGSDLMWTPYEHTNVMKTWMMSRKEASCRAARKRPAAAPVIELA